MSFYDEMASTAGALLEEFGAPVTLTRVEPTSIDSVTGIATGDAGKESEGIAAVFDYTSRDDGESDRDGTTIKTGDKKILLSVSVDFTPKVGDKIVFSETYKVISVREINPAGTAVLYIIQGRR